MIVVSLTVSNAHESREDQGVEVDDHRSFLNHALHFPMDDGEESRKAERDYDPRRRGARAKRSSVHDEPVLSLMTFPLNDFFVLQCKAGTKHTKS